MTEAEWLAATDPTPMLAFLGQRATDRRMRLFATVCCRRISHLLTDVRSREFIEASESYADDVGAGEQLDLKWRRAVEAEQSLDPALPFACRTRFFAARSVLWLGGCLNLYQVLRDIYVTLTSELSESFIPPEKEGQSSFLRDVFGNPFHPVVLNPSWLTSTVVSLAEGIYQDRAFDRLPILADALQDAGCDNEDVLNHCRGEGPHVRGCFVIDLLLGKE
jgi:hypothetical protein